MICKECGKLKKDKRSFLRAFDEIMIQLDRIDMEQGRKNNPVIISAAVKLHEARRLVERIV